MITLRKAGPTVVWKQPMGEGGGPLTWRRIEAHREKPKAYAHDLAFCTCDKGHEQTLSAKVHVVSVEGIVSPSYVCPRDGCGFHDYVVLEGWTDGAIERVP